VCLGRREGGERGGEKGERGDGGEWELTSCPGSRLTYEEGEAVVCHQGPQGSAPSPEALAASLACASEACSPRREPRFQFRRSQSTDEAAPRGAPSAHREDNRAGSGSEGGVGSEGGSMSEGGVGSEGGSVSEGRAGSEEEPFIFNVDEARRRVAGEARRRVAGEARKAAAPHPPCSATPTNRSRTLPFARLSQPGTPTAGHVTAVSGSLAAAGPGAAGPEASSGGLGWLEASQGPSIVVSSQRVPWGRQTMGAPGRLT